MNYRRERIFEYTFMTIILIVVTLLMISLIMISTKERRSLEIGYEDYQTIEVELVDTRSEKKVIISSNYFLRVSYNDKGIYEMKVSKELYDLHKEDVGELILIDLHIDDYVNMNKLGWFK